jgi:hypothetical protein
MEPSRLNSWMQVIGIFALVASLLFVGLQMKQTHEIALAGQYQARAETTMNMYMTMQESGVDMMQTQLVPMEELAPAERITKTNIAVWGWTKYENHHFQHQAGYLNEETWAGLKFRIQDLYNDCAVRPIFDGNKRYMRASFVEYVESLGDNCA